MDTTANIADVDMGRTVHNEFYRPCALRSNFIRSGGASRTGGVRKFDGEIEEKEANEIVAKSRASKGSAEERKGRESKWERGMDRIRKDVRKGEAQVGGGGTKLLE